VFESSQEKHKMVLEKTYATGAEEWCCPTCGRRFIMRWPPRYEKIVLEPGDEYAIHSGGKGGIRLHSAELARQENVTPDEGLAVWRAWIDEVDFESWWYREL